MTAAGERRDCLGYVTVSATASDNMGWLACQFLLDGVDTGYGSHNRTLLHLDTTAQSAAARRADTTPSVCTIVNDCARRQVLPMTGRPGETACDSARDGVGSCCDFRTQWPPRPVETARQTTPMLSLAVATTRHHTRDSRAVRRRRHRHRGRRVVDRHS